MKLKYIRNSYYRIICKIKWLCWENFLQEKKEKQKLDAQRLNQIRHQTALKYAKLQQFKTMPVLKDSNEKIANTMKAK